jgi:hypothetical protein
MLGDRMNLSQWGNLEDGCMNLLRSICCIFSGRCGVEEPKPGSSVSEGDLGQKEAELEKTGKEQMSHMEGDKK